jgi:hypothetical protein
MTWLIQARRSHFDQDGVWEKFNPDALAAHEAEEGPVPYNPYGLQYMDDDEEGDEEEEEEAAANEGPSEDDPRTAWKIQKLKWNEIRDALYPEPLDFKPVTYKVGEALSMKFMDTGLQVIVKMASIELTPEKPVFPAGGWHVSFQPLHPSRSGDVVLTNCNQIEGQMNEHIVATALYYLDSENVTPSRLSFRMAVSKQHDLQAQVGQDLYDAYEYIYGTWLGDRDSGRLQTYGSVETPEGRLLAFPNVL